MRPRVALSLVVSVHKFFEERGLLCTGIYPGEEGGSKVIFGEGHTFYTLPISKSRGGEDDDDRRYDAFVAAFRRRLRKGGFNFTDDALDRCRAKDVRRSCFAREPVRSVRISEGPGSSCKQL